MRFAVRHETLYRYSVPVVLAPHVLRLTPRDPSRLRARSLAIWPEPADVQERLDGHGNLVTHVMFTAGLTDQLRVESRLELDTVLVARPGFDPAERLPWGSLPGELEPYRPNVGSDPAVAAFARGLAAEVGDRPLAFLDHLCRTIHARADGRPRTAGDAQGAAETLVTWRGACRDLTVLFVAAARSLGMPARFCSGYQAEAGTAASQRDLHAWPEVYVPGAGWLGWDPTQGRATGEGHVALGAAPDQADTMPVAGGYSFNGPALSVTLDFQLTIATS